MTEHRDPPVFGEIRVGGRVIQVMVGGKDLGHPSAERVDPPDHGFRLRRIQHRGLSGFVTHDDVGVVVPERGDPLDRERHGIEASCRLRELPLASGAEWAPSPQANPKG
jgi:hypothetical protein